MSEAKHTPGPWESRSIKEGAPTRMVCGPLADLAPCVVVDTPEDAALIAAAPDLLCALKELLRTSDEVGVKHFDTDSLSEEVEAMQDAAREARAAIAKATGAL